MISLQDIIDMTDLTEAEIAAIGEHEHSDMAPAASLADYLMHQHHGPQQIQTMICDDIRAALHRDDVKHARELFAALRHFMSDHPDAARGSAP